MSFNLNKCEVLHIGNKSRAFNYEMREGAHWLKSVEEEIDLGILIDSSLRLFGQCIGARNKPKY